MEENQKPPEDQGGITVDMIRGWLHDDNSEPAPTPAAVPEPPAQQTAQQVEQPVIDPRLAVLDNAKVTTADALKISLQYASIGRNFESRLRAETKRLCIAAYGTDADAFASTLEQCSVEQLGVYAKQFTTVIKGQKLANNDENEPQQRLTTPDNPDTGEQAVMPQTPEQRSDVQRQIRMDLAKNFTG